MALITEIQESWKSLDCIVVFKVEINIAYTKTEIFYYCYFKPNVFNVSIISLLFPPLLCIRNYDASYRYESQHDSIVTTLEQGQSISNLASYFTRPK